MPDLRNAPGLLIMRVHKWGLSEAIPSMRREAESASNIPKHISTLASIYQKQ